MKSGFLTSLCLCSVSVSLWAGALCSDEEAKRIAQEALGKLSLEDKCRLVAGESTMSIGKIDSIGMTREWNFSDSSHTVHSDVDRWDWAVVGTNDEATVLPPLSALSATWNVGLSERYGHVVGEEARDRDKDQMLGPGVNLMRTPRCGRNWEYLSEDPCLTARMVVPEIRALQSHDVAACVKHFCVNNQEDGRTYVDTVVDERALNELYLEAFRAAIMEGGALTLMTAFNKYNGVFCGENAYLLRGILRERWGFKGSVVTDWGGQHSTVPAALNGGGIEMNRGMDIRWNYSPKDKTFPLADAVRAGEVPLLTVDEMAFRTLWVMAKTGFLQNAPRAKGSRNTESHFATARAVGEEAIMLLKNEKGVLPLDRNKIRKLVLVGSLADAKHADRGSSATGNPLYEITPAAGIAELLGPNTEIVRMPLSVEGAAVPHQIDGRQILMVDQSEGAKDRGEAIRGWRLSYWKEDCWRDTAAECALPTTPAAVVKFVRESKAHVQHAEPPEPGIPYWRYGARLETRVRAPETGSYLIGFGLDPVSYNRFLVNGKVVMDWQRGRQPFEYTFEAGQEYDLTVEFIACWTWHGFDVGWVTPSERAVGIDVFKRELASADATIVFTGNSIGCGRAMESEGQDRETLQQPVGYDQAMEMLLPLGAKNLVVVNISGAPVEMPWVDKVDTLVQQPFLGQEAGRPLARVLFGDVNPSGKLPCTWPKRLEDTPEMVVGAFDAKMSRLIYNEGIYIGYRWYDHRNIEPMFPFGFGLSYTTFEYGVPRVDGLTVRIPIRNVGSVRGKETVQVYIHAVNPKVDMPVKQLRGFDKVDIVPGETVEAVVRLCERDFAYWDVMDKAFRVDAGRYELWIGASSSDVRQKIPVGIAEPKTFRQ